MGIDYGKWEDSFKLGQRKQVIREISQALGYRLSSLTCKVSRDSNGSGIVIQILGTHHTAPLIHLPDNEWQKHGVLGKMVREALADADDPGRIERSLCGGPPS
jgi:hypothetical protein